MQGTRLVTSPTNYVYATAGALNPVHVMRSIGLCGNLLYSITCSCKCACLVLLSGCGPHTVNHGGERTAGLQIRTLPMTATGCGIEQSFWIHVAGPNAPIIVETEALPDFRLVLVVYLDESKGDARQSQRQVNALKVLGHDALSALSLPLTSLKCE
ncbi:hypothetical protein BC826DRAFT_55465 [Russula brevipes]|nr:hypothetical protein BC826DRAFT_55465 [Russula brevipes]